MVSFKPINWVKNTPIRVNKLRQSYVYAHSPLVGEKHFCLEISIDIDLCFSVEVIAACDNACTIYVIL